MTTISIQQSTLQDLEALRSISIQTFTDTFAEFNTPEDMEQYLAATFNTDQLTQELSDPDVAFYLAKAGTETIGYLKLGLSNERTEFSGKAIEIERIYVSRSHLGLAVGQQLLHKALSVARESSCAYIWLGVWEHNPRAIRFYEKNGFIIFGTHLFKLGNDLQTDLLMQREL